MRCGVRNRRPASGTERVIVLAETRVEDSAKRETLRKTIVETVVKLIGRGA